MRAVCSPLGFGALEKSLLAPKLGSGVRISSGHCKARRAKGELSGDQGLQSATRRIRGGREGGRREERRGRRTTTRRIQQTRCNGGLRLSFASFPFCRPPERLGGGSSASGPADPATGPALLLLLLPSGAGWAAAGAGGSFVCSATGSSAPCCSPNCSRAAGLEESHPCALDLVFPCPARRPLPPSPAGIGLCVCVRAQGGELRAASEMRSPLPLGSLCSRPRRALGFRPRAPPAVRGCQPTPHASPPPTAPEIRGLGRTTARMAAVAATAAQG